MKKTLKFLIIFMLFLLCACKEEPTVEPIKLSVMTEGDTLIWNELKIDGVELDVELVPKGTISERILTAEKKPNIIYLQNKQDMEALTGVLLDMRKVTVSEYERASIIFEDAEEQMRRHTAPDGGRYVLPLLGKGRANIERAWLYRADVFERAGIEIPNTMHELYLACLKLKTQFAESTPLALRDGYYGLDLLAPAWSADASIGPYYDFDDEKWKFGICEPWAGNFISYWSIMAKNELIPKEYLTMTNDDVDKLISLNRVFIVPDYVWRLEEYKEKYPYQDWRIMPAPRAATEDSQNKIAKREGMFAGFAICDVDVRENTASVAVLNEIYKKICAQSPQPAQEREKNARLAAVYTENEINPARYLSIDEDGIRVQEKVDLALKQKLSEFLTGARPMIEWAEFAEQIKEQGTKKLLNSYKRAYTKVE